MNKSALVLGGGGFIGHHLVKRLKEENYWVRAVDLQKPAYEKSNADEFVIGDLTSQEFCNTIFNQNFVEVYQLAADMGGAGYLFSGENDASVMYNSAIINLNVLECCRKKNIRNIFFSSSACVYNQANQDDP